MLRVLSLFSGIGAFEKALTNIGVEHEVVNFCEIDPYAITSYCTIHKINRYKNIGDISRYKSEWLPKDIDLITYGFPCQDLSLAGKLEGIKEGTRSGLLYEAERIICHTKSKYAIAENVKNLVSKRFIGDFNLLLDRLGGYGYNNYWQVLNAKDYGVPQNRERVFVVSIRKDIDDGSFEFPKPFDSGLRLKDLLEDCIDEKYFIENERVEQLIKKIDFEKKGDCLHETKRLGGLYDKEGERHQAGAVWDKDCLAPTLDTVQGGHREPLIIDEPKVAVREATKKGYAVAGVGDSINIAYKNSKLRRGRVGKGVANTLETQAQQAVLVVSNNLKPSVKKNFERDKKEIAQSDKEIWQSKVKSGWQDNKVGLKVSPCLRAHNSSTHALDNNFRIRKLTPLECWRLMGFEDEDYHRAKRRLEFLFYNGNDRSDSQMYKQAGNSIVVNVLEELFMRLFKNDYTNIQNNT